MLKGTHTIASVMQHLCKSWILVVTIAIKSHFWPCELLYTKYRTILLLEHHFGI